MNVLVVVAHPDDETLGAGATIHRLSKLGHTVGLYIMSAKAEARYNLSNDLRDELFKSSSILGINPECIYLDTYPNNRINTVDHLELVQSVEAIITRFEPEWIITHHPEDLNNDHYQTSLATQVASRLYQRRPGLVPVLKKLWYMEVPSSTDWGFSRSSRFNPNTYVYVDEDDVKAKFESLKTYTGILREYPHPRSYESLKGLLYVRGSQAGKGQSEAFESVFDNVIL